MSGVTVITAALPERADRLLEAIESVAAQTVQPDEHLIAVDYKREGGARVYSMLASMVTSEWTAILPDDDVLYPEHIEKLLAAAGSAEVVYSWCEATGHGPWQGYNQGFDPSILRVGSIVSHVAMVRTDLIQHLGGWQNERGYDWRFWVNALESGAEFVCVPEPTWRYRLEPQWRHESRGGV